MASRPRRARSVDDIRRRTDPASSDFRILDWPFYRIARVAALYTDCLDRELKPRGLDQPRWRVLMILSEHNPTSMGVIAELAVMKLPTLLKLVKRMSDDGLVRHRPRLSDQRVTEVSITPEGRKALALARRVAARVYAHITKALSARDVEMLNGLLGQLENTLMAMRGRRTHTAALEADRLMALGSDPLRRSPVEEL